MRVLLVLAMAAASVSGIGSPQQPSFAGRWVLTPPPPEKYPNLPECPRECVIAQDAKMIEFRSATGELLRSYRLDGAATDKTVSSFGYTGTVSLTAKWDGATLVLTSAISPQTADGSGTTRRPTPPWRLSRVGTNIVFVRDIPPNDREYAETVNRYEYAPKK